MAFTDTHTGGALLHVNEGAPEKAELAFGLLTTSGIAVLARVEAHEQSEPGGAYGGDLVFKTNAGSGSPADETDERMRINTDGFVGIGTSTPTERLEVIGTVKALAFEGNGSNLTNVVGTDPAKLAKAGDTMTGPLTLAGPPALALHAATKQYVDDHAGSPNPHSGSLAKAGDTMTGPLTLAGPPAVPLHAATKQYVDAHAALPNPHSGSLAKAGDTMTGPLTLAGPPAAALHAVTKQYVDDIAASLSASPSAVSKAGDTMTGPLAITATGTSLETAGRLKVGALSIGPWPANTSGYVHFGTDTLDQANSANYALLQDSSGGGVGRTYLNSPVDIRFRIKNADKMILYGNGNVTVKNSLTAENLFNGQSVRMGAGQTPAGSTDWKNYGTYGVYVDVDTSAAKFSNTPLYLVSMHGSSNHWATVGGTCVYSPTKNGFRVYVRWADKNSLTPEQANNYKWHLEWVGIELPPVRFIGPVIREIPARTVFTGTTIR